MQIFTSVSKSRENVLTNLFFQEVDGFANGTGVVLLFFFFFTTNLNSSKLISRKILVVVKFLNFHTVTIIYTLVVLEKIAFCPKMMIRFCEVCWMTDQLWKTQHSFCENAGFLSLEKCKDFLILIPIVPNHNSKISYWHSIHNLSLSLKYVSTFERNFERGSINLWKDHVLINVRKMRT